MGVGGWLDQVGIRLTQLSTGLEVEAELGKRGKKELEKRKENKGAIGVTSIIFS